MSGEYVVLTDETRRYATLEEKHNALSDLRGPLAGEFGVMNNIEAYLIDSNRLDEKELARRTPFFSRDQREHIIEHVKAIWTVQDRLRATQVAQLPVVQPVTQPVVTQPAVRPEDAGTVPSGDEERTRGA